ncbi:MAG TPA: alpha-L-arabinofuranosidase C-terminal domain-containing protein [Chthonomonadaceae bacterium]|nr:alpha-L-arabinofuranosidase C-terminal domain-containing protein [Chthonomonadaceae bacterium]
MPDATIDVRLDEPIATINPHVYGHFMEHLGGCIDEGCWVGEDALIANTGGIRDDVVAALKAVGAPVIRWPGGCFADDYHWQDGIGPRESRPRRVNMHWGQTIENNHFGTHEFLAFCRAVGADPYLCGNVGSGTPQELRDWAEYCNFTGDSTLARMRTANGSPEPLRVRYWGVGNENWGCGGHFTPEDYAAEYRRFATYLCDWGSGPPFLIACGPNGNDTEWTRRFFTKLRRDYGSGPPLHGFSAHYYTWSREGQYGTATEYTPEQFYGMLGKAVRMEPLIVEQRDLMDEFDPQRKIGLIVDEWGTWHPPTPGRNQAFQWQQSSVRDALVAALTLDIFNRHADKVIMANIAQTINVLQALLLTDGDRMLKTPTYHVYALYRPHQGGQAVRIAVDTPETDASEKGAARRLPLLSGSASLQGKTLTLTVVNASATESLAAEIRLSEGAATSVQAQGLRYPAGDIRAHNTHDAPDTVSLEEKEAPQSSGSRLAYTFPPASATRLTVGL